MRDQSRRRIVAALLAADQGVHEAAAEVLDALAAHLGDHRFRGAAGTVRAAMPPGRALSHKYETLVERSRALVRNDVAGAELLETLTEDKATRDHLRKTLKRLGVGVFKTPTESRKIGK
jgi:hypothetical protein